MVNRLPNRIQYDVFTIIYIIFCTIFAIGSNFSQFILAFKMIRKPSSYKVIPELMLVLNILSGVFWQCYWMRNGILLGSIGAIANTFSSCLITSIYLFYRYPNKLKFLISLAILVGSLGGIYYFFGISITNIEITGQIAEVINILRYAGPGQNLIKSIKTKNYQLIPAIESIRGLICSVFWIGFGLFVGKLKVAVPNGIGFLLSITQIIAYYIEKCLVKKEEKIKKEKEKVIYDPIKEVVEIKVGDDFSLNDLNKTN